MTSYLLKLTLQGTPNLIWRRFVVPSFITLSRLHDVVQTVMGWEQRCPHLFLVKKQNYVPAGIAGFDGLPESAFSLDDIIFRSGGRLKYVYDPAGDKWIHHIIVESVRYFHSDIPYPIYCLEGARTCPPESCGGVEGFVNLLKNSKQVKFDPDDFGIATVNKVFGVPGDVFSRPNIQFEVPPENEHSKNNKPDLLYRLGLKMKKAI